MMVAVHLRRLVSIELLADDQLTWRAVAPWLLVIAVNDNADL
jgi:hypothetical protein